MSDNEPWREALSRNRLDEEGSPYLRQHADNPVDWQPWDDLALRAARELDRPIFLSVGYSACHWCHVMEEESFADPGIAQRLNESFVPVKVDREERPDLDDVYQTVSQAVTGRGGWPLSVWLTPAGDPFYVGTYFPPDARHGRPGFGDLLDRIADSWASEDRAEMENRADQWAEAVRREFAAPDDAPSTDDDDPMDGVVGALVRSADREEGGFGSSGPKFPQPTRLLALARACARGDRPDARAVLDRTLSAMADGGLQDHLGGGFHRYATDRDWTVPHFEKMLYDNAELPRAYLAAYRLTGENRYATVARRTFDFLARELRHPDGGFYATLDAQSEGQEGSYYVWTPEELRAAAGEDGDLLVARYGVTEAGNFEGENVLRVERSVADLATAFDIGESTVRERLERGRERALATREERPRPRRDEKVIAGWNGLAVGALAEGELALGGEDRPVGEGEYATLASEAVGFVREHLWDADRRRLERRYVDGDVGGQATLEDYAFLGRGLLELFEATGDPDHLGFSLALARTTVEQFHADGTLYATPADADVPVARPQDASDQSTPASLGVAVDWLASLAPFQPAGADPEFGAVAREVVGRFADRVRSRPVEHVSLALAADRLRHGAIEVTAAGDEDGRLPEDWRRELGRTALPNRLLAARPGSGDGLGAWLDDLGLAEPGPVWADRDARDGPTLYVCRDRTCSPPLSTVEEALAWVEDRP
jgi:uncharacterized protein YyaL (SSP411 family)